MKNISILLICISISCAMKAQGIIGAWETFETSEEEDRLRSVAIFADGYHAVTTYNTTTGEFSKTYGGSWKLEGDLMTEKIEFDTATPERVGDEVSYKVALTDADLEITDKDIKFSRIDAGEPGALQGAWLMSGRVRDGKTQQRDTSRPRKTMKILSGTRFQWIAYNTETKEFMGSGGGTYTTVEGAYTENIEFFSRDDSKAGLSLEFTYELVDGNWHHSGLSSKGDPIHEIWSIRE